MLAASGSVSVRPSPSGFRAEARSKNCVVDFLRNPPERGYDEIAEVYTYYSRPVEPQDALRKKACDLGADAVIVARDFLIAWECFGDRKLIAGIAIKYRDTPTGPEHHG